MIRHNRVTQPHAKQLHNQSERTLYNHNFINDITCKQYNSTSSSKEV